MLTFLKKNTALPTVLKFGSHAVPLIIRRNRRAKRICLRVNTKDHAINLTLPARAPVKHGMAFLKQKHDWLSGIVADLPQRTLLTEGAEIPLLGKLRHIEWYEDRYFSYRLMHDRLVVWGPKEKKDALIFKAVKEAFRETVTELSHEKAAQIGKSVKRVSIRDPRTRWGSCSADRSISFSWRLAFAPARILDYVVAHEVAHLRYMHHGARFWDLVEDICPNYQHHCAWLKENGQELFRFSPVFE